jgi:hypothetical protein
MSATLKLTHKAIGVEVRRGTTASPPALVPGGRLRSHAGELERRPYPLPH